MSKRLPRLLKKNPLITMVVVLLGAATFAVSQYARQPGHYQQQSGLKHLSGNYDAILVMRVVDGDTLKLANGDRVRLIGIDTPEMHESQKLYRDSKKSGQDVKTIQALGRRAYAFTKGLVEGKTVKLEFDVEKRDKYGRLLAYVYLSDGTFVNAQIVKEGYASIMTYPPNVMHADEFLQLYRQARDSKVGLWKD